MFNAQTNDGGMTMKTGDQGLVKKINKSIVLNNIQTQSPISRAQISKVTGLNKATVSSLVSELIEERLVDEIGAGLSSGGRKPMMLFFNQNAGYTIGIDLGVNYAFGILTDLKGNVIEQDEVVITDTDEEIVFAQLKDLTQRLIDKTPACRYGIVGIGIGVPGMINNEGLILFAPNLDWHNVHLKQYMEKYFNVPITIENEAKAGAHGEKIYGAGRSSSNLIYVSLGIGIGSGIIIEDKLYKGTSGISGEIGHFSIESNGRKCRCGNKGCWELYSSELALLEKTAPLFPNEENVNLSFLIKQAEEGNPLVINAFDQIGEYIGIGLTNIVNTFNPEQIIIGNRLARLEPWLRNPIQRVFKQRLLPYFQDSIALTFTDRTTNSCALGSAAFSIEKFFATNKVTIV